MHTHVSTPAVNSFVKQIARGLGFLHAQTPPIAHSNLKPSNVLVRAVHVPTTVDPDPLTVRELRSDH
jgi:serine/threonine protein kinase